MVIPKFSIVIPTYNRATLLGCTLESALLQEGFEDYEVVIVDDCSSDGTWDYLRTIENSKLKTFRNDQRLGMGQNWNKTIELSSGEYIFLLQDDDLAMPNLLARAAALIEKHRDVDLLCFTTCLINGEGQNRQIIWQPDREQLLPPPQALMYFARHWTLSSTQVIFSRSIVNRYGDFDTTQPIMSDAEAILRWMVYARTLLVPEILALRRYWEGSVTSATEDTEAMAETMDFLVNRVSHTANASGTFSESQVNDLSRVLQKTFIKSDLKEGP